MIVARTCSVSPWVVLFQEVPRTYRTGPRYV